VGERGKKREPSREMGNANKNKKQPKSESEPLFFLHALWQSNSLNGQSALLANAKKGRMSVVFTCGPLGDHFGTTWEPLGAPISEPTIQHPCPLRTSKSMFHFLFSWTSSISVFSQVKCTFGLQRELQGHTKREHKGVYQG
jgi:hypothetical protein